MLTILIVVISNAKLQFKFHPAKIPFDPLPNFAASPISTDTPQTLRETHMWIRRWKQWKKKSWDVFFSSQHFGGKRGMLEFQDRD